MWYKLVINFTAEIKSEKFNIQLNKACIGSGCLHHLFFVIRLIPESIIDSWAIYNNGIKEPFCTNLNYPEIIAKMDLKNTFDNSEHFFKFVPKVNEKLIEFSKHLNKLNLLTSKEN